MANLAASDITYSINQRQKSQELYFVTAKLTFGDGAKKYPTGGIPITEEMFGVNTIRSLIVIESNGNGLLYEYDRSAVKLRIFTPTLEMNQNTVRPAQEFQEQGAAPAAAVLEVQVIGTNISDSG